jgi:hypothetical protein
MSTGRGPTDRTTPFSIPGNLTCAVRLSKELIKGLRDELHKPDLSRHKPQLEAVGLLFGTIDPASVLLERLQPVDVGDFGASTLLRCERLHNILGERISEARSSSGSALLGWYVIRADGDTGLLERDIDIHNTFFRSPRDAMLVVRLEAKEYLAIEVYSAETGGLLSKSNHRAGSWRSANLNALAEHVDVPVDDSGNDEFFLNTYRTAKSLDEAETPGKWKTLLTYTARLMPAFGTTPTRAGRGSMFSAGLKFPWISIPTKMPGLTSSPASTNIEWTLPSKPLVARIDDHVLEAIQRTVLQEGAHQPELCVGGLLLGARDHSPAWQFTIQRHIPVGEWDASRGGAPFVTEAQSRTLKTLASWPSTLTPIGFYRTYRECEGKGASKATDVLSVRRNLMEADRSVLTSCLTVSAGVGIFLQIDASTLQPCVAVLWEDGNIYELFPKGSSKSTLAPKPDLIIAGASRSFSEAVVPLQQPSHQLSETTPAGYTLPSRMNLLRVAAWLCGTILISLFTYICAHVYLKPLLVRVAAEAQTQSKPSQPATTIGAVMQEDILNLRIDPRAGGAFELSWNPHSTPIQTATSGTLWMTDSTHFSRTIHLSAEELQSGHIMYTPASADITFHLKVTDRTGRETMQWIRVLNDVGHENEGRFGGTMKSGLPVEAQRAVKLPQNAASEPAFAETHHPIVASSIEPKSGNSSGIGASRVADDRPSMLPRNDNSQVDLSSLFSMYVQKPVYSPTNSSLPSPSKNPEPPEPSSQASVKVDLAPQPQSPLDTAAGAKKLMTEAYPPRVLFRYVPRLPMHVDGRGDVFVPVLANISESGKVTSATLANPDKNIPRFLMDFALRAALKWRFLPATVNGRPVVSSMTITFHFPPPK